MPNTARTLSAIRRKPFRARRLPVSISVFAANDSRGEPSESQAHAQSFHDLLELPAFEAFRLEGAGISHTDQSFLFPLTK